ncbi:MAG TPA: hypothetical protein ENJ17_04525 [Gammaproteobacteria bacterium]|nr:hypothetical protein [Gammaproteobacteria bacterium]
MSEASTPAGIPAQITQGDGEVRIDFDPAIPRHLIEAQVGECQAQTCECCTPEFREKVEGFEVDTTGAAVTVRIKGHLSPEQVHENVLACTPKLAAR